MRRETIWRKPWFVFLALAPVIGADAREKRPTPTPTVSASPSAEAALPHVDWKFDRAFHVGNDTQPLSVGDTVPYSLEGAAPTLLPEAFVASEPKDAELGIALSAGGQPHSIAFTIPGKIQIPERRIVDSTGKAVALTDPTVVEVKGLELKPDEKPETLYGPIAFAFPRAWLFGALALLALFLGYAIHRAVKWSRARRLELARVPEPPKPLFRVTLSRLDAARNGPDFQAGRYKKVAYEYSESLKEFLSGTFDIPAEESTTFELVRLLNDVSRPDVATAAERLYSVLDLIKFTDYVATEAEIETLYRDSCQIVTTYKREEVLHEAR